jgi:hypothetical protein
MSNARFYVYRKYEEGSHHTYKVVGQSDDEADASDMALRLAKADIEVASDAFPNLTYTCSNDGLEISYKTKDQDTGELRRFKVSFFVHQNHFYKSQE